METDMAPPEDGSIMEDDMIDDADEERSLEERRVKRAKETMEEDKLRKELRQLKRKYPSLKWSEADLIADLDGKSLDELKRIRENAEDQIAQIAELNSAEKAVLSGIALGAQFGGVDIMDDLLGDKELHKDLREATHNFFSHSTPSWLSMIIRIGGHVTHRLSHPKSNATTTPQPQAPQQETPVPVPAGTAPPISSYSDGTH